MHMHVGVIVKSPNGFRDSIFKFNNAKSLSRFNVTHLHSMCLPPHSILVDKRSQNPTLIHDSICFESSSSFIFLIKCSFSTMDNNVKSSLNLVVGSPCQNISGHDHWSGYVHGQCLSCPSSPKLVFIHGFNLYSKIRTSASLSRFNKK